MEPNEPRAKSVRPATRRAPPKLTLKKFLHDLWKTDRYTTFAGARRAVGRCDDWTEEEREIAFAEIDKKFPDAPPRVKRVIIANADPAAVADALPTARPLPGLQSVRHYDSNLQAGSIAHCLYATDQYLEAMRFYAERMKGNAIPELQEGFARMQRMHEEALSISFEPIRARRALSPTT
jgi:hypothetical protein